MPGGSTFKATIIGGGPTGLALAHMLHLAGIDYTLYDKRDDLCERHGAGLAIQPQNCRILDQLGLLDAVIQQGLAPELRVHREFDANGRVLAEYPFFQWLRENHGYTMLLFERWQYIRLLHDKLPDRDAHIRTGKVMGSFGHEVDGKITVRFTGGSVDECSVLIGADGVYSKVRDSIVQQAPRKEFRYEPYDISFRALYGIGALPKGMDAGVVREIPHKGWWFQIMTQPDRVFYMLYQALDQPITKPVFYDETDAETLAQKFEGLAVGERLTFGQLRKVKTREKLAVLEEGVLPQWHWKRVVLVGDAVHKVTPNHAHSANIGLESAACLVNNLRSLLKEHPSPSEVQLGRAFREYQAQRAPIASLYLKETSFHLRALANVRLSVWQKFVAKYVYPRLGSKWILDHHISPLQAKGVKLDFVNKGKVEAGIRFPYSQDD